MECLATGFGLIEGPVWDAGAGLYFSDAVGGMALHGGDGLVMGGRDIAVVRLADGKTSALLSLSQLPGTTGFNDLTVDATGRVYVGSLTFRVFSGDTPTPGFLQRINLDGTLRPWRPFATFGGHGTPDGMKVAVDGSVWVAVAHAGIVRVFNADGSHRRDIEMEQLARRHHGKAAGPRPVDQFGHQRRLVAIGHRIDHAGRARLGSQ